MRSTVSFNPVHKPVMVTTLFVIGAASLLMVKVSIPFTNRSWLQHKVLMRLVHEFVVFQSRSQTGHGYNPEGEGGRDCDRWEFQSRSQTGHGYNTPSAKPHRTLLMRFNPVHKPVMVTTTYRLMEHPTDHLKFQSRSQTGHGYNLHYLDTSISAHTCFNPVHKPVMVTTMIGG